MVAVLPAAIEATREVHFPCILQLPVRDQHRPEPEGHSLRGPILYALPTVKPHVQQKRFEGLDPELLAVWETLDRQFIAPMPGFRVASAPRSCGRLRGRERSVPEVSFDTIEPFDRAPPLPRHK